MIRWIIKRLGTCAYNERPDGDFYLVDVRHLVDKGGNSSAAIAECIASGAHAFKAGKAVIVACDFGVSRSNSIAAGILSVTENCVLDEAVARVMAATGESEIKLDMLQSVRTALSADCAPSSTGTVMVTGGNGFLGHALVPRLQTVLHVVAPSRDTLNLEEGAVKLATYCKSEGVSQIVHLAYPRVYTNVAAMASGLAMLRTVLDTCRILDIRLIFVSGSVVFGGYVAKSLIVDENTPLRPKGAYSDAKFLEEMLVGAYVQRGEVRRSICRLSPVYGPGGDRPRLIKAFRDAILSDKSVRTHSYLNGRPSLDLLYVTDAADAIARTVEERSDSIFHFGSGANHTTLEIAELIAKKLAKPLKHEELLIEDYIANVQMDIAKVRAMLGWNPSVPVDEGLEKCLTFGLD